MRHAWMILAHNHFAHLKKLIAFLDSESSDIYLHIDAKAAGADPADLAACASRSRVICVERHSISWGDFSMVEAELALLRAAVPGEYDYYHLLSGVDVPVKTRRYIEEYFTRCPGRNYISFLHPVISRADLFRVRFHYPFQKLNIRRVSVRRALRNASIAVQLLAGELEHLLLDIGQIGVGDGLAAEVDIIVEAVFHGGTDAKLDPGIQGLESLCHKMGGGVPENALGLVVFPLEETDLAVFHDRAGDVDDGALACGIVVSLRLYGNSKYICSQPGADTHGYIMAGNALLITADAAIRKSNVDLRHLVSL